MKKNFTSLPVKFLPACLLTVALFTFNAAQAQSIYIQRVAGTPCVGTGQVFVLMGSSCSSVSWSIYPTTGYTILSQSSSSIQIKWNVQMSNISVSATYNNCSGGVSGTTYYPPFTVGATVAPSVSVAASTTTVCASSAGNVTFTASPVNGGTSPYYFWQVNGNTVTSGSSSTFTRSIASINNGDIVRVNMSSNLSCVTTSTATSNGITMTVTQPSPTTATIGGPSVICSGSSSGVSFGVTVINGGTSPVYTWLKNGLPVTDQTSGPPPFVYVPQNPLNNNDKIKCRISFSGGCVSVNPVESNEYTVSLTSQTAPYVSIQIPNITFCSGSTINFGASSPYITGSSSYSWKLNGTQFSTASAPSLPVTTDTAMPNAFSPGDVVTVTVSGLSGTCLSTTSASASTSGIPFNILAAPGVSINPVGTLKIRSTETQPITASSGYTYQWKKDGSPISPGGNVNPYTATTAGTYTVFATGANGCSKESNALILSKNGRPVANAGPDKTVTIPETSATLYGSGSDSDGTIVSYSWSQVAGPSVTMTGTNSAGLSLSGLSFGIYTFQLVVTDDFGEPSLPDNVKVTVAYPPNNYNWVKETTILVKDKRTESDLSALQISTGQQSQKWSYFDGLGRPTQVVDVQGSPTARDIVQPVAYDNMSRQQFKYLPFTSSQINGWYKRDALAGLSGGGYFASGQFQFYQSAEKVAHDSVPFNEIVFEKSPLSRPLKNYAAGQDWDADHNNKFVEFAYLANTDGTTTGKEQIIAWKVNSLNMPVRNTAVTGTTSGAGYYPSGALYINSTKDEHGNEVREYLNKSGLVILKKVYVSGTKTNLNSNANWVQTYYIYDDLDNLRFVLQPELVKTVAASSTYNPTAADLNNFGFIYRYDNRQRMIVKKVPGADSLFMVYDNRDRLVMTQDGNMRRDENGNQKKQWTFIKYDRLNRPIVTGLYTHSTVLSQAEMTDQISTTNFYETYDGNVTIFGYTTNSVFPTNNLTILTVTYYDDYDFKSLIAGTADDYTPNDLPGQEAAAFTRVRGQITGTWINIIGTSTYLWSVNYYDSKYRNIQTKTLNYKGGIDRVSNKYDFVRLVETKTTHNNGTVTYTIKRRLEYGHAGRLTKIWHAINTEPEVLLVRNEYNELGQLVTKKLHQTGQVAPLNFTFSEDSEGWTSTNGGWDGPSVYFGEASDGVMMWEPATTGGSSADAFLKSNITLSPNEPSTVYIKCFALDLDGPGVPAGLKLNITLLNSSNVPVIGFNNQNVITFNGEGVGSGQLAITAAQAQQIKNIKLQAQWSGSLTVNSQFALLLEEVSFVPEEKPFAQETDYRYNIRGWLSSINDVDAPEASDLFSEKLNYNTPTASGGAAQFNGNISEMLWKSAGTEKRSYGYTYDNMNRLLEAKYYDTYNSDNNGRYDEIIRGEIPTEPSYDLNGNIQHLQRFGKKNSIAFGNMDKLNYGYIGNQLAKVTDHGDGDINEEGFKDGTNSNDDYAYDWNGNMKMDQNKDITGITYNYLNLPVEVKKSPTDYILYTYDAAGRKLKQQVFGSEAKTTEYLGEFVYENNALQFILDEEGRVVPDNSAGAPKPWEYQYFLKDHLGNVRVMFSEKKATSEYLATMEKEPASVDADENSRFLNMISSKKIAFYNHTPGKTYSYRLSGSDGEVIGPAKSFEVNPGDVVDMEVYARYNAPNDMNSSIGTILSAAVGAFGLTPTGSNPIDGAQAHAAFSSLFSGGPWITPADYEDPDAPKAFLNYILFDQDFNLVDGGFDQVGTVGEAAHDYLSLHIKVKQKGYLYIYLSNENDKIEDVYFDDFKIVYNTGVEQVNDYYPFGLAIKSSSFQKQSAVDNSYRYNGKELQDELNIGWLDFGARFYMPDIGVWGTIDPMSDKYHPTSPYAYALNNPILVVDPDGRDIIFLNLSEEERKVLERIINHGLQGQFKAVFTQVEGEPEGTFTLTLIATEEGGDTGKLTAEGKSFYDYLDDAIKDTENNTRLDVVNKSENVDIGKYSTGQIDVADISQFNDLSGDTDFNQPTGATQQGKFIHELVEQHSKARKKGEYTSHMDGSKAEGDVNGNKRLAQKLGNGTYVNTFYFDGTNGIRQVFLEKDGSRTIVLYKRRSDVINVIQNAKPTGLPRQTDDQ